MINILKLRQLEKERKSQDTSIDEVRRKADTMESVSGIETDVTETAQAVVPQPEAKKNGRKSNSKPAKVSKKPKKQQENEIRNLQEEVIPAEIRTDSFEKIESIESKEILEKLEPEESEESSGTFSENIIAEAVDPAEQFRQSLIEQVLNDESMISREELRKEIEEKEAQEKIAPKPEIKPEPEETKPAFRTEPAEKKQQPQTFNQQGSYKNEAEHKAKKSLDSIIQLVGFIIGKEYYGIDIKRIKEINRMTEITKVPRAPQFIEGVINLRGTVIPVINLRTKVRMPKKEYDKSTRIIIVELSGKTIGFIVDGVKEVLRIPENLLAPPPALAVGKRAEYITAVAKLENDLVILMDPEKLLTIEEASKLN